MPEGDTVFLAGKRLDGALAGKTVLESDLRHPRLATVDLSGREVLCVHSVGKHLFTRFSTVDDDPAPLSLHTHFRMDGSWHLYRPGQRWGRAAHHVRAILRTGDRIAVGFRLHDMELLPTNEESRLVGHLGPDLLAEDWSEDLAATAAAQLAAQPEREVGLALLDQRIMAGVGNIYRTEACFLLGVTPWSPVSDVDPVKAVLLCRKLLLRNAWRPEQSTTGETARGRQHFAYNRAGKGCLRCGTPIRAGLSGDDVEQRSTWYCPRCQRGPHP